MAKRTTKEKNNEDTKLTLHKAIEKVLIENDKQLTANQIAKQINKQKLYIRNDGKPLLANQVAARVRNYPSLFYTKGNAVGLNIWGNKKAHKKSALAKEIEFILEVNEEPLSVQIITETINKRNEYSHEFEKDFTTDEILEEIKKNDLIFKTTKGKVELIREYDEYDSKIWSSDFVEKFKKQKITVKEIANSIESISVANFKPYNNLQELKLKPLTLLFGPNSSGKSSLIHSVLYLQNSFDRKDLDPKYMKISGDSVELGGFKQLIHKNDFHRKLKFSIKLDKEKLSESLQSNFKEVDEIKLNIEIGQPLKIKKRKQIVKANGKDVWTEEAPTNEFIPDGKPKIEKYEILLDSEVMLSFGKRENHSLQYQHLKLNSLNYSNEIIQSINKKLLSEYLKTSKKSNVNLDIVEEVLDNVVDYFYVPDREIIPNKIKLYNKETISKINKENSFTDIENFIIDYFPISINGIIEELFDTVDYTLKNLIYLGPMRSYPTRDFSSININDPNYFAGGAFAWDILLDNEEARVKVNDWLEKLEINYEIKVGKSSKSFYNGLLDAGKELDFDLTVLGDAYRAEEIADIVEEKINEVVIDDEIKLALVDKTNTVVSPRDVGFGISQIIPVLVSVLANKNKIVLIEQPEIHLHPGLQAKLADAMIESALGKNKNTLILENHSEHMMLRILRRIRETTNGELPEGAIPIRPEDVNVIYIQNTEDGAKLNYIPITDDGDFEKRWPEGFFPERAEELF